MRNPLSRKIEYSRVKSGPLGSDSSYGPNGVFLIWLPGSEEVLQVIASNGEGWEHVSVTYRNELQTPSWDDMCYVKGLFWEDEERVIQYHPPTSQYVNCHPHVLHLWKPIGIKIPFPPNFLVGP